MDLQGYMDALGLDDRELAINAYLSIVTVKMAKAGRPVSKYAVDHLLDVLSDKYGRKIEREEVEGLLLGEETQA